MPDTLVVRELRYRIRRRGYRTRTVTLVTTLLDAERYPQAELADLYYRRWQAEINLRDLKETLGLRVLRAQTVAGVEREVLALALLYNLLCAVRTVIAIPFVGEPRRRVRPPPPFRRTRPSAARARRPALAGPSAAPALCGPRRPPRTPA